jgi:uncharacterized protein
VGWLESLLAIIAGLTGGFVSILASNGSAVTLPALEFLGFPEHVANGTNRLSVVALGLVGTVSFYRRGLLEWRKGSWIALFLLIFSETDEVNWAAGIPLALGSAAGAYVASLFATQEWAKVWVYRFLVLLVILSIVHLLTVDASDFLSRNSNPAYYW